MPKYTILSPQTRNLPHNQEATRMGRLGFSDHIGLPHQPLLVKLQVTPQTVLGLPSSGTPDHSSDEPPPRQELNQVKPFRLA